MDLTALRAELDAIDAELLALFLRRMVIVEDVARYKIETGAPVLQPQREQEIIDRVRGEAGDEYADSAEGFFRDLLARSRERQQQLMAKKKL